MISTANIGRETIVEKVPKGDIIIYDGSLAGGYFRLPYNSVMLLYSFLERNYGEEYRWQLKVAEEIISELMTEPL